MTNRVPISFEFFPPNTPVGDAKLIGEVVPALGALKPEFFSVTYGAGGSTREKTLKTVQAIAAAGFEAAPHISCVGSTREGCRVHAGRLPRAEHQAHRRTARRPAQRHCRRRRVPLCGRAGALHPRDPRRRLADRSCGLPRVPPRSALRARATCSTMSTRSTRAPARRSPSSSSTPTPISTSSSRRKNSAPRCRSCPASCPSTISPASPSSRNATASTSRAGWR